MPTKIIVTSCQFKKEFNGKYGPGKIYTITTDDTEQYDCFTELQPGEHEVEIEKTDPQYPDRIKPVKSGNGKKPFTKNYDFEKRRVALECATALIAAGKVPMENLIECRNKFYNYLNEQQ